MQDNPDTRLFADTPVSDPVDDQLGRAPFAERLATAVLEVKSDDGFVFGVHGEWGAGKTSVVNLVVHYVRAKATQREVQRQPGKLVVVPFNPWWYSTEDDLLLRFLTTISHALGRGGGSRRLKKVGRALSTLGKVLAPAKFVAGAGVLAGTFKAVGEWLEAIGVKGSTDAATIHLRISALLRKGNDRLLVVLDDIDRLTPGEVCQLVSVIKAVANFPKTVYLLAFDRTVVADSLKAELGIDGYSYIDKLIQASTDIPLPDARRLDLLLTSGLDELLGVWDTANWDQERWLKLHLDALRHMARTPRDVKRYLNAIRLTCTQSLRAELNPVDVFGLEALRLFAPTCHSIVRENRGDFAGGTESPPSHLSGEEEARRSKVYADVQEAAPNEHRRHVAAILALLFPKFASATQPGALTYDSGWEATWRKQQRICARDVFPVYFQFEIPVGGVPRSLVDHLVRQSSYPHELGQELLRIGGADPPDSRLFIREVLERIKDHTPELRPQDASGFLEALFAVADDLIASDRDAPRGPLQLGVDLNISRLSYQLLMRLPQSERRDLLLRIVREAPSLFSVVQEAAVAEQHWEEADKGSVFGEALVAREDLSGLRDASLDRIRLAALDGNLVSTPRLAGVLWSWRRWEGDEPVAAWVNGQIGSDDGLRALLIATLHSGSAWGMGSYHHATLWYVAGDLIDDLAEEPQAVEERVRRLLEAEPLDPEAPGTRALKAYVDHREGRGPGIARGKRPEGGE